MNSNPFESPKVNDAPEAYIEANIFRGFAVTRFVDHYAFYVPEIDSVRGDVIAFFELNKAKLVHQEPLTFQRGNLIATLLGPERSARQRIVVYLDEEEFRVRVEYHINLILPTRWFFNSFRETRRLAAQLGAINRAGEITAA